MESQWSSGHRTETLPEFAIPADDLDRSDFLFRRVRHLELLSPAFFPSLTPPIEIDNAPSASWITPIIQQLGLWIKRWPADSMDHQNKTATFS
jgi:hypothetical protein